MANKIYNYLTPGEFTYDSDKIEVSGGIASLKEDLTNIYARYHLNESSGDNVPDDSGNGRDGTRVNSPTWVSGKLNNALQFNGSTQRVSCGDIANFERTDPFSLECWIKIIGSAGDIIKRKETSSPYKGWAVYNANGQIGFDLINSASNKILARTTASTFNDNIWHHVIVTYDGTSLSSGVHIYVDDNDETLTVFVNNLTASILNTASCLIGIYVNGLMDEVLIYDKELTPAEVTYKYNLGAGRENWYYYIDKPTIEPTDLFEPVTVSAWNAFLETLGGGNEGSIGYNLYKVDKANKYYWNGGAWVTGGSSSNYNSQVTINANIGTFDASPDKIGFIVYLISDGEQAIELDENQITYSENLVPLVNAGSNKTCKDNVTISPFSDCSFSDPDGTVDHVYYKVDGEIDNWIEIPQGGYGTLLEAIQAWTYQFVNIGIKTVRLQVEDNEASKSEDSLEVTVLEYIVTFNVRDGAGLHVSDFNFIAGDSSAPQLKSSPFTYEYGYKVTPYDTEFNKEDYISASAEVASTDHTENIILSQTAYIEVSRIYHPIRIELSNLRKSIIDTLIKGDTVLFECKVEADIIDWKIRAHVWDDVSGGVDIKKATSNSGGNDFQIEITDATGGVFIIKIDKGETTDIENQANLEIELETNDAKIYTVYQSILKFTSEKITWDTP